MYIPKKFENTKKEEETYEKTIINAFYYDTFNRM